MMSYGLTKRLMGTSILHGAEIQCTELRQLITVASESKDAREDMEDLRRHVMPSKLIISGKHNDSEQDGNDSDYERSFEEDEVSDDEASDIIEDVEFHINCLNELAPTIKRIPQSAMKVRQKPPHSEPEAFYVSDPAKAYVLAIRERFKKAQTQLVERLGEANWQRHVTVRKQMSMVSEHDPTLSMGLDAAHSLFQSSAFHDSGMLEYAT